MTKKILLIIGILAIIGIAAFLILGSQPQKEGEGGVGFSIRNFFPFGKGGDRETGNVAAPETGDKSPSTDKLPSVPADKPIPGLRKISSEPVAGAVIFNIGTTSLVRFVEKGTGNVYEARSDSMAIQRLTNTTIPKIIRAFWLPNASGFLAQTLMTGSEIIETSFVKLNKNTATSTASNEILTPFGTKISKLPTDIKEISVKPDSSKIFYYTNTGSSDWFISNPDGTGRSRAMTHPLTEWIPKWVSSNLIMMQNKGSSESVGYSYLFDIQNKTLKKVGFGVPGLSFNSNADGSLGLISSGGASPRLFIVDNKSANSKTITANTLAEKCVWLKNKNPSVYCAVPNWIPNGNYPDVWYKGLVQTEDSVKRIDLNDNALYSIADLFVESGERIDVIDISISPNETHLIFRNKIDGFLWMLRIEE